MYIQPGPCHLTLTSLRLMLPRGYMVGMWPRFASEWGFLATLCMICFIKTLITRCWCTLSQVLKNVEHFLNFPSPTFQWSWCHREMLRDLKKTHPIWHAVILLGTYTYIRPTEVHFRCLGWGFKCHRTGSTTVTHTVKTYRLSKTLKHFQHLV